MAVYINIDTGLGEGHEDRGSEGHSRVSASDGRICENRIHMARANMGVARVHRDWNVG